MLYIVRHAETPYNVEDRVRGTDDPSITAKGRKEARVAGELLNGKFDRIVADDYKRTQETARIIAPHHIAEQDNGLNTWDVGSFSGKPIVPRLEQDLNGGFIDHPGRPTPGGESVNHWLTTWKATYDKYRKLSKKQNIVLVTHGRNLSAVVHGFKPDSAREGRVPELASVVRVGGDGVPKFLETKLKSEAKKKGFSGRRAARYVYGAMNNMGAMKGNKETAKGKAMQAKHTVKLSDLKRAHG